MSSPHPYINSSLAQVHLNQGNLSDHSDIFSPLLSEHQQQVSIYYSHSKVMYYLVLVFNYIWGWQTILKAKS